MSSANPTAPNRAELLRQRRSERPAERPRSTSAQKAVKSQPVLVRNVSMPVQRTNQRTTARPVIEKTRKANTRRQYYYSMGATGAELRLPALPVVRPGWRLVSFALVILFGYALYLFTNDARFSVSSVDIVGLQRLDPAAVNEVLALADVSILEVQPAVVKEQLAAAFPELEDIQISVTFPASVGISAVERQPQLAWQTGEQTYWIDPEGVLIPPRGEALEPLFTIHADALPPLLALPVEPVAEVEAAEGKPAKDTPASAESAWGRMVDTALLAAAQELQPYIPAESNLVYNTTSGLGWTDPRGWKVFVGSSLKDIELKLVEYQAIVDALGQQGIVPGMISVEHVHAPFYRMEP